MGVRANIASTYRVEYKGGSYFNNKQEFLEIIISFLECELGKSILVSSQLNEDGCGSWEVSRLHLDKFIDYIDNHEIEVKNFIKSSKDSCFSIIDESDDDLYIELSQFLKALKYESDKTNDYILISWF